MGNAGSTRKRRKKRGTSSVLGKIRIDVLTIFPSIFDSFLGESLVKKALKNNILDIRVWNLRKFASDVRRTVDDRPFGGGPGMVLQVGPIERAVSRIMRGVEEKNSFPVARVILFSPRGKKLNGKIVKRLSRCRRLIFVCGRYEGIDERVARYIADEEISIGDYTLNGGEIPAMALIEAIARFIPGFLGKYESLESIRGSYPSYTRPAEFVSRGASLRKKRRKIVWKVPSVLVSGNHKKIQEWRRSHGVS